MNLIKEVKGRANIVKVAEFYGMELNRAHKCRCPFHSERTASLSISEQKQIFHCFGCGVGGDVINLVSKLLNINAYEAAKSINYNLDLGLDFNSSTPKYEINRYKEKRKIEEAFKKWELETYIIITDYLELLHKWQKIQDIENDLYIETLQQLEYTEYIVELFLNGTYEDKIWFWKYEKDYISKIKNRISTLKI